VVAKLKSFLFWPASVAVCVLIGSIACDRDAGAPTVKEATRFFAGANETLLKLGNALNQAGWVAETFITDDTEAINAKATQDYPDAASTFAKQATRFDKLDLGGSHV